MQIYTKCALLRMALAIGIATMGCTQTVSLKTDAGTTVSPRDSETERDTASDTAIIFDSEANTDSETFSTPDSANNDPNTDTDTDVETDTDPGASSDADTDTDTPDTSDEPTDGDTVSERSEDSDTVSERPTDTDSDAADDPPQTHFKGLCVVADFSNQKLEDLDGEGFKSEADIAPMLDEMSDHWAWLSRGLETMTWDIVRVTLPEPLAETAYPGWVDYRDAVVTLMKEKIDTEAYDADMDGDVDAVWIIASDNGTDFPYLIGGASFNAGAHVFVDGQASESIKRGAIGNFNHELGHLRGLPDLYGDFTTVDQMTLMAYSWAMPPHDFGAYERIALGWLSPQIITESTNGVTLLSADVEFAAVKVPTARPEEYFLLEYRVTPKSGYGSASPLLNGLVVYHVLEGSHQRQDPPLIKVEPADGDILPGTTATQRDLYYPDNPDMQLPAVTSSYFGGDGGIAIDNLAWVDGGIRFDVLVIPSSATTDDLIANSAFETCTGDTPSQWTGSAWQDDAVTFGCDDTVAFDGTKSAVIENTAPNDAALEQTLTGLIPGQSYQACMTLRGEDITGDTVFIGGNVSVTSTGLDGTSVTVHSDGGLGTFDFREVCATFTPGTDTALLQCRLGHWSNTVTGKLWCDHATLHPLESAFQ